MVCIHMTHQWICKSSQGFLNRDPFAAPTESGLEHHQQAISKTTRKVDHWAVSNPFLYVFVVQLIQQTLVRMRESPSKEQTSVVTAAWCDLEARWHSLCNAHLNISLKYRQSCDHWLNAEVWPPWLCRLAVDVLLWKPGVFPLTVFSIMFQHSLGCSFMQNTYPFWFWFLIFWFCLLPPFLACFWSGTCV